MLNDLIASQLQNILCLNCLEPGAAAENHAVAIVTFSAPMKKPTIPRIFAFDPVINLRHPATRPLPSRHNDGSPGESFLH